MSHLQKVKINYSKVRAIISKIIINNNEKRKRKEGETKKAMLN